MISIQNHIEPNRCVRCGICKSLCPTYLTALDESMGARGRVALLRGLDEGKLKPTKNLSEKVFSCLLCEACKGICPVGLDIPEIIYQGRRSLRRSFSRGKLLRKAIRLSIHRMDTAFILLRLFHKLFYQPLYRKGMVSYLPPVTQKPLKKIQNVFRNRKAIARVGLFMGCSVNYLYPSIGESLIDTLTKKGYEVVILSGEVCCGAPLRSIGFENEMIPLAKRNIELFKNIKAKAIISLCPTCTMVIRTQYPSLTGDGIPNIMDVNEFFINYNILKGLRTEQKTVTYHDPCHLNYGLGITEEPRKILIGIEGIRFVEMKNSQDCCGFGGLFSSLFRELSIDIGRKKVESIKKTGAQTVVTSCPGCIMQLEGLKKLIGIDIDIMHIIELIDEAMN